MRYSVNLSMLFTELDLLHRPAAAKSAGFDAAECWWPFGVAVPADREVGRFITAFQDADVRLTGLNFYSGDMSAGERGVLSVPGRANEFIDNVAVAVGIAEQLGGQVFNAPYGNRVPGVDPGDQDDLAVESLRVASEAAARIGATVLIEPLSGVAAYPLRTAADAVAVLERVDRENVRLLADVYHLAVNGDDVPAVLTEHIGRIGHVQIADAPGRGEPGTGDLDIRGYLNLLDELGYRGLVALEYAPHSATASSFGWLPR